MLKIPKRCAGCGQTVHGNRDQWCPVCEPTVKPFVVQLTAAQRKHIEAQAVVRGVSHKQVIRDLLLASGWRKKARRRRAA